LKCARQYLSSPLTLHAFAVLKCFALSGHRPFSWSNLRAFQRLQALFFVIEDSQGKTATVKLEIEGQQKAN
jgi:hypothetical protein